MKTNAIWYDKLDMYISKIILILIIVTISACGVPLKFSVRDDSSRKYEVSVYIFYGGIDNYLQIQPMLPVLSPNEMQQINTQYNTIQTQYKIDKNWLEQIHFGATVNF